MNNDFINKVRNILPDIPVGNVDSVITQDNIYSPVEEHRYGVGLSCDALEKYTKYTEFITRSFFISHEIFENKRIMSQELVINKEDNILALCDLSTENAVLEIKTNYKADAFMYRNQLFYEANGRKCFLLQIDWSKLSLKNP